MKLVFYIFAIVGLAWVGWRAWQRFNTTDEQRVQLLLESMVKAVERSNLIAMEDALASDYSDNFGLDKSNVIGAIRSFRSEYDAVFIDLSEQTITLDPDQQKAQATFLAKIRVRAKGALTETDWRQNHFRVFFRKANSRWKTIRVEAPELKVD